MFSPAVGSVLCLLMLSNTAADIPESNALVVVPEAQAAEAPVKAVEPAEKRPEIVFLNPKDGDRIPMWAPATSVAVAIRWRVKNFDLDKDGKACFLLNGQQTPSSEPHTCLKKRSVIDAEELGLGTWTIEASLVDVSGAVVFNSTLTFEVVEGKKFVPSYEWQRVEDYQSVPPGLDIRLPLDGVSIKEARIPPTWQLQLYLGPELSFFRPQVTPATTILQIRQAIAAHAGVPENCVVLSVAPAKGATATPQPLNDASTVEEINLFAIQSQKNLEVSFLTGGDCAR